MKVLTGHLTHTEIKHIKAILDLKLQSGKVGRKTYFISHTGSIHTVKVIQNDKGLIPCAGSKIRESVYTHTFTL